MGKFFPQLQTDTNLVVYFYSPEGESVLGSEFESFSLKLKDYAESYRTPSVIVEFQGYYIALEKNLVPQVAQSFVSSDNASSIITITANMNFAEKEAVTFAGYLKEKIDGLMPPHSKFRGELTGLAAFIPGKNNHLLDLLDRIGGICTFCFFQGDFRI